MTIEQYLYRLCRNILNERFDWRKYLTTRSYFGRDLCVTPLHVSYGQIGYTIHFPYSRDPMPELAYDWEMDDLTMRLFPLLPQSAYYHLMMQIASCPSHPCFLPILKLQHPHSVAPSFPKTLRLFSA